MICDPQQEEDLRPLLPSDFSAVVRLLEAGSLSSDDLTPDDMDSFLGIVKEDALAAVGGLQLFGSEALMRSVVTDPDSRGRGYARRIARQLESDARRRGVRAIYLLTETAATFFESLGYRLESRAKAPASIAATDQFAKLCPDSAGFMIKRVGG